MTDEFLFPGEEVKNDISEPSNRVSDSRTDIKNSKVFKPLEYKEAYDIVEALKNELDVIMDLELMFCDESKREDGKRIVDYVSGAIQVLNLSINKINSYTFLISK